MFETAILTYNNAPKRVWTTCMGVTGQALLVLAAVLAPMIWPQVLLPSGSLLRDIFIMPTPPIQAEPRPVDVLRPRVMPVRPFQFQEGRLTLPGKIPPTVIDIDEPPIAPGNDLAGGGELPIGSGAGLSRILNVVPAVPQVAAPVRTAPAPASNPAEPLRVQQGGLVKPARLVHRVEPVYPPLAKAARISGVVQLEGVIGTDGRMRELQVRSGHPLLVGAAVEAVRQWVYAPTTLNSEPVEVIAPITVTFRLQ
jgi:protein TonB